MGRRTRPVIAAVLALAVAGLGHVYLRRWVRAAAWFLTIVITAVVLVSAFADPTSSIENWPLVVLLPIMGLFVLSATDAYLLAARVPAAEPRGGTDEEGDRRQCPNCGREVDPDLDFCHWCTQRLSFDADAAATGPRRPDDGGRAP